MKRQKCEECGGRIVRKKVDYVMYGFNLGSFPAEVCMKCGEEVFEEKVSDEIEKITKEKGLYGLGVRTRVGVVGNCLDIRVNKRLAKFIGLKKGEEVTIAPEGKNKLAVTV